MAFNSMTNEASLFRAVEAARSLSRGFPIADACRWASLETGVPVSVIERYAVPAELDCARAAAAQARAALKRLGGTVQIEGDPENDE
jgi:hypothetical protein